jgi:hypothetical protein
MGMRAPTSSGTAWTNPPGGICKICDHKGTWCQESSDGEVADCRRVSDGAFRSKTDANGADHHFHRLKGDRPDARDDDRPQLPEPAGRVGLAHANVLHEVYSSLLSGLPISTAHRAALRHRGLSDEEIGRRGYGSKPDGPIGAVLRRLHVRYGDSILGVPGFIRDGHGKLNLACMPGILVPVRDAEGRIVAMKVRPDRARDGAKYLWLSSAKWGGPKALSACHVPLGIEGPADLVRITEGELKADLATVLNCVPTISAPGVSNWKPAMETARELGAKTIRIAYDMDAADKDEVAKARAALASGASKAGLIVEIEEWDAQHKGIDEALQAGETTRVSPHEPPKPKPKPESKPRGDGDYITTKAGVPRSCVTNAMAWLKLNGPRLEYDTFRDRILVGGEVLRDEHIVRLGSAMEVEWGTVVAKTHVDDALRTLAGENAFSSLERYLNGLKWDGVPRIGMFFPDYFDVEATRYHQEVGRILFRSGAARGLNPGCKVDTVPLMIGAQGAGKSHTIAALCPDPEWFTDEEGNIGSDRAGENLRGKWLVEMAELSRVNQTTLEAVKKFITRQHDRYKVPYEREPRDFARTNIFIGSTNDDTPLKDIENRRFLPVRVPRRTDEERDAAISAIKLIRDQLWAEAVHHIKGGEKWWTVDAEVGAEVGAEVDAARREDPWEGALREKLEFVDETTLRDAAALLGVTIDRLDRRAEMRVSGALKAIGFERKQRPVAPRTWYYLRVSNQP